jgi:predicted N-acetyltransferase YhbS
MTALPNPAAATLVPLDDVDPALVEDLLDRAFEPERRQRTAYKIRGEHSDALGALSFAAIGPDDRLAGTIQCWPVALTPPGARAVPLIMVGPVAVLPEYQGAGYGQALMLASLGALSPEAPLPLMMIGDPEYYGRFFGFSAEHTGGWTVPGPCDPARLLCRALRAELLPREGMLGPWRS